MEKRIQEIISRCKAIDDEQAEIERTCELENQGKFTDDLREKYGALKAEFDALVAEKKQLEDDAELKASRAGRATLLEPRNLPRRSQPTSAAPIQRTNDDEPLDDEPRQVRFKIPANVRRHTPRNFSGTIENRSAEERAYRFGQWCLAKLSSDIPGKYKFRDAQKFVENYMAGAMNVAHGESDGTTGGQFLVPEEFSSDLIVLRENYGVARRIFGREQMTSDTKNVPKRSTGLTAYFPGESSQITESNMTWENIQLVAKKMAAITRMSSELSADAVIAVGDELAGEIAYAFANKEDDCAFNGDGTSTYAGIYGCRNSLDDVTKDGTGTNSAGLVTAAGNGYDEITAANLTAVVGTLPDYADTPRTRWVCHRVFYFSVMEKLLLAQGGSTAQEMVDGKQMFKYLGYPVEFSQVMPSATGNNQVALLFGDFTLGAKFGDRSQVSIQFSEHAYVNSTSVFEYDQIAVRGTERFDIVVHGQGTASAAGPIVGLIMAGS